MKTRIISALVGIFVLAVAIAFYDTMIFNLFITALAVIAIYEAHHAAGLTQKHLRVTLYCALYAVLLLLVPQGREYSLPAVYVLVVLVFAYILEHHREFTIREGAYALLMGIALPTVFGLFCCTGISWEMNRGFYTLHFCWAAPGGAISAGILPGCCAESISSARK